MAAVARHLPRGFYPAALGHPPPTLTLVPVSQPPRKCLVVAKNEQRRSPSQQLRLRIAAATTLVSQGSQPTPTQAFSVPMAIVPEPGQGGRGALSASPVPPSRITGIDPESRFLFFDDSGQEETNKKDNKTRDMNKANLGTTLRILQERIPTLLQSPLPQDILAPNISLHLFPSTHPHLPTVSGRVAYNAALWTSPIAWNRVPLVGNVRVEVLSERMTRSPLPFGGPSRQGAIPEQLVVRWKTTSGTEKKKRMRHANDVFADDDPDGKDFTGLFIFQFDQEGRILSHTIEHAQLGDGWERGVGARVVGLTDWLLGGMRGSGEPAGI